MPITLKTHYKSNIYQKGIAVIFFLVLNWQVFSQGYNFRNFNSEDGLAKSIIYSIIQDNSGYLWIGTDDGLSRYNGFTFENFTTKDSLADNFVTCSIDEGDGLWFGHMNGRLSWYNGRNFQSFDLPPSAVSPVTHFAKGPDGRIWVSTYSGSLLRLNKDSGAVKQNVFKDQVSVVTFDFLDNGELLVGTNSGLLYCRLLNTGEIEKIRQVTEIPESKVTCIKKMRDNQGFLIATENDGIYKLLQKENQFAVSKLLTDTGLEFSRIQDIFQDSHSDLWVGSFGTGLRKLSYSLSGELSKINDFNKQNGFASDNVKTINEDREGNIWSGNYGEGLTQITPKTFSVFTFDKPIYGKNIFSTWFDSLFRWQGTENGLVKIDKKTGNVIKFYSSAGGFPKDTVTSIYSENGKVIWIGTGKSGLFILDTGTERITKYPIGEGLLENSINIITGKGDQVWVGTKKGLCRINPLTGTNKWYNISQGGLPHNYINSVYYDRSGKVWVTTRSNILSYILDDKIYKIPLNSINRVSTLGPVTEDTDSRIWVGSNGNGVFMIKSDSITNITVKEGLLSNYCYSLICDNHNNLWVGHKVGLSRIRTTDFLVKPIQHIESITDSYQFNPNAVFRDNEEKIWFGTDKGLVSYDPSIENSKILPPVLGITSLRINDIETDFTHKIVLSPGKYDIRIAYLGVSLKEPTLVSYQYQMEGYDRISEITKNTSITYSRLTEGEYRFILYSASGDGAVSENPLIINIIIKRPVWKNWWFYALILVVLMMIVLFYIKRREYKFRVEKQILEDKVLERTYEIQCQKNEIELQRDLIDEKNINITASIQYASHIQNAVLPPLELLDELLPDNFILSKPKDIVSGDFYWMSKMDNRIIFAVADCTGHGVPGAFMSMLGITLLNSIVNIQGFTDSDIIVTKLRDRVLLSLKQGRKNAPTSDGMDITLCVLDKQHKRIQFTGGMNDLVYVRDGNLNVVKADRLSVCIYYDHSNPYTKEEFEYKKGDVFYLFSDGFEDQFGGPDDKKYLGHRFYARLLEIHSLPMAQQKEILDAEIIEWMKNTNQTDDITVMGIRL